MTNIELYINGSLCDLGNDFSIRLNRQLINPAELNTKDAQYSYGITLPATSVNNAIFNYAQVEETKNKFNVLYEAQLIVNGVKLFTGNLRLSNINRNSYKGNLYKPSLKSIKDIFGELKLNEVPAYYLPFQDFATSVNTYNFLAATVPQIAIFPFVLYGLLPKIPFNFESNEYSARDVWDATVKLGMSDLPPSINPLLMLRHIFQSQGYQLLGTAFEDDRLRGLYMSYKNDPEYVQPWNYGRHAIIRLHGAWSSVYNKRLPVDELAAYEAGVNQSSSPLENTFGIYSVDMFDATNTKIVVDEDPGANVSYREQVDDDGTTWVSNQVRIPVSGFYKVSLGMSLMIYDYSDYRYTDPVTGVQHMGCYTANASNEFDYNMYEFRLLRDRKSGDFGLSSANILGTFYKNNQPQNDVFEEPNVPKFFPQVGANGQVNFIDLATDRNIVLGFMFGERDGDDVFKNPKDENNYLAQIQAAKPALSWNTEANDEEPTRLAINSPAYWEYGRINTEETDPVLGWKISDRYDINLQNAPANVAFRGGGRFANGSASAVVWLEAGELLTLADVSREGRYRRDGMHSTYGWVSHEVTFDLSIQPFREEPEWLKVNFSGNGTGAMNWNDPVNFDTDNINVAAFLPADIKTDDFIENFCKAFNLKLSQVDSRTFTLDVKQAKSTVSSLYINLDRIASVKDRENESLGLPSLYKIGFTVNQDEEGYFLTGDEGGGEYSTGVLEENIVEQKSNFSYNWFKNITKDTAILPVPIITKHEAWLPGTSYAVAMRKRYTDLAQRFWYYGGLLNNLGANFEYNGGQLLLAQVVDNSNGSNILNYKNKPFTILDNFFTILVSSSSHYTRVKARLTAVDYESLDGSRLVMFNGDLYLVAELSAYDPTGINETDIKLIRLI